jgi:hypothetical protein
MNHCEVGLGNVQILYESCKTTISAPFEPTVAVLYMPCNRSQNFFAIELLLYPAKDPIL